MVSMVQAILDKLFNFHNVCMLGHGSLAMTKSSPKHLLKYHRSLRKIYRSLESKNNRKEKRSNESLSASESEKANSQLKTAGMTPSPPPPPPPLAYAEELRVSS